MPLILDSSQIAKMKRKRTKRLTPVKSPVQAERYIRKKTEQLWERVIFPSIERIKSAIASGADLNQLSILIENELRHAESIYGAETGQIVDMWRLAVDKQTRAKLNAALNKSLGIDTSIMLDGPIVSQALSIGSLEAESLIKTMPTKIIGQVASAVMDNMRGIPLPEGRNLLQQIEFLGTRSKAWAKVIARDQTSKLTATLNQARHQSLGITEYIWRTMRDDRVVGKPESAGGHYPHWSKAHMNHYLMEGKYCKYSDPTVYSDDGETWKPRLAAMPKNHPGTDVLDRCFTEPRIDLDQILAHSVIQ